MVHWWNPFRLNNGQFHYIAYQHLGPLNYSTLSLSSTLFYVVLYWPRQATVECVEFCVQVWGGGGGGGGGRRDPRNIMLLSSCVSTCSISM